MKVWESVSGMVKVELTGAEITRSMEKLNHMGIEIQDTELVNSLCVRFSVSQLAYPTVKRVLTRQGDRIRVLRKEGAYWKAVMLIKRPVLLTGLLLLLLSALYIPNHIYFIQVRGNHKTASAEILAAAEACGVYFGVPSGEIRSETVKNQLLERLPQLQWAAINTRGCVATIQIREREQQSDERAADDYSSIVALRDGVITQCTVYRGNLVCKTGQAVKEGDLLISGLTDCGLVMKCTGADGEILAQTKRQLDVVSPNPQAKYEPEAKVKREYALRIGKNIIKFSKDSGIPGMSCVKMYEEKYMELPGGFQLPIAWICETSYGYTAAAQPEQDVSQLEQYADDYLQTQMVGGRIVSKDISDSAAADAAAIRVYYSCLEMIGKKSNKEILQEYGQTD